MDVLMLITGIMLIPIIPMCVRHIRTMADEIIGTKKVEEDLPKGNVQFKYDPKDIWMRDESRDYSMCALCHEYVVPKMYATNNSAGFRMHYIVCGKCGAHTERYCSWGLVWKMWEDGQLIAPSNSASECARRDKQLNKPLLRRLLE